MPELFNKNFINAVQNTVGEAKSYIRGPSNSENDSFTVKRIISKYNDPSIKDIKKNHK